MKILFSAGALLLLAPQFLYQGYAVEICEPQDYYNLANGTKCSIQYNKDPRESMFEIMKNYPFEKKDVFVKLLQRKIELVDNYLTQQQGQVRTEKVTDSISKLKQAKKFLIGQPEMVNAATRDNWERVRDQARKALEETVRSLREVE